MVGLQAISGVILFKTTVVILYGLIHCWFIHQSHQHCFTHAVILCMLVLWFPLFFSLSGSLLIFGSRSNSVTLFLSLSLYLSLLPVPHLQWLCYQGSQAKGWSNHNFSAGLGWNNEVTKLLLPWQRHIQEHRMPLQIQDPGKSFSLRLCPFSPLFFILETALFSTLNHLVLPQKNAFRNIQIYELMSLWIASWWWAVLSIQKHWGCSKIMENLKKVLWEN